jgi:dihydrofolate reductase
MRNEVKSAYGGRKIFVLEFMTLDGVIQAPGGSKEDTAEGFKYGGWMGPYFDEVGEKEMEKQMKETSALLLGRKTYDIWTGYWPEHTETWPQVNKITKYVVSKTLKNPTWENTEVIHNTEELKKLKNSDGPDLQVYGSANLVQTLMEHDLVDEFWLKIFPITLGTGKKLFQKGTIPAAFTLVKSNITPSGVIIATYKRAGEIKTGSF